MTPQPSALRRAVFLDRDGTLIHDPGDLSDPSGVKLLPGVPGALRQLAEADFTLIVITNQSGIGRGLYTAFDTLRCNTRLQELLAPECVDLADIYFCPHTPDDGCDCRKPEPGLLFTAAHDHRINLAQSAMIGDKMSDRAAGQAAGCRWSFCIGADVSDLAHAARLIIGR